MRDARCGRRKLLREKINNSPRAAPAVGMATAVFAHSHFPLRSIFSLPAVGLVEGRYFILIKLVFPQEKQNV
jgi:hypothetical protein